MTRFLIDSGLAVSSDVSPRLLGDIALENATLSGALLAEADLRHTNLIGADLRYASLSGADLRHAALHQADLRHAALHQADLRNASLGPAYKADLRDANFRGANLSGAIGVTNEELEQQAVSLKGATMPNGQKHGEWLKSKDQEENKKSNGSS